MPATTGPVFLEAICFTATWGLGACLGVSVLELLIKRFSPSSNVVGLFPPWIAIAILPVFLIVRRKHFWLKNERIYCCKPPPVYPHAEPLLGLDWFFIMSKAIKNNTLLDLWDRYFKTIGHTYWHQTMGGWVLLTNEPENLKVLLATGFDDWPIGGTRQKALDLSLGPHAIFSVNGAEWQAGRALIRPSFVRNQIADLECQDRHVERFLGTIPRDGSAVDLQRLFYLLTMDSATDFMLGYSTDTLVNPSQEALDFAAAFDYSLLASTTRARLGWATYLIPDKKFNNSIATCKNFVDRYVEKAVAEGKTSERPYIFLNEILKTGASRELVRDQLLAIIIGGRDTSASTMSSLFWTLARRPDVVKKLRQEIGELGARKPNWDDLKGMKYLALVLKETLRLWPPVTTNLRVAAKDTTLPRGGGPDGKSPVFVPKGMPVRWSLHSLHRREDSFGADADEFRPERWENLRTSWEYIPFSGGPRICIGQQFAQTQMSYLIARMLQTFEFVEPADERPMTQKLSATTSLANGCWVRLKPTT